MGSTVKSRPNHYEVLGLTPAASSEEIAQAFAEQLDPLRPRAFGSLAEVTIAFETLRDRARREAYDVACGLKSKPTPPSPEVPAEWAPFLIRASARPVARPAAVPAPPPAPNVEASPQTEPAVSPFAAARREPIRLPTHEVHLDPVPTAEESRRPDATARPAFELQTGSELLHFDESRRFRIDSGDFSRWKLPALAAGTLVLAVSIGAWTGLEAGNDNEQAPTENSVTIKVPAAKPLPELAGSPLALTPNEAEARPQQSRRADAARIERPRPPLRIDLPEAQSNGAVQLVQGQPDEVASEQTLAETPVAPTPASLPLPNAVVARTIGRIGYPCGQVATASAMGGGVFKVTCTSGHSYRAAPVRGRYRFRRM